MPRLRVGFNTSLLGEDDEGVELESAARLAPGRSVQILRCAGQEVTSRQAMVERWRLARIDRSGPVYRGYCRWAEPAGHVGAETSPNGD